MKGHTYDDDRRDGDNYLDGVPPYHGRSMALGMDEDTVVAGRVDERIACTSRAVGGFFVPGLPFGGRLG